MCPLVTDFVSKVSLLSENDYGDFMRLSNLYLNELRHEFYRLHFNDGESKFKEMQLYLQYHPTWQVEETRHKLLADAKYLDEILQGHAQDWESAPTEF